MSHEYLVVIGGRYRDQIQEHIYALDLSTLTWVRLFKLPLKFCAHSSELVKDCVYIFGGTDGMKFLNDLLIFNLSNNKLYQAELKKQEIRKINMDGRMASSMSFDAKTNTLLIFGGCGYDDDSAQSIAIDTTKINIFQRAKLL